MKPASIMIFHNGSNLHWQVYVQENNYNPNIKALVFGWDIISEKLIKEEGEGECIKEERDREQKASIFHLSNSVSYSI